MPPKKNKNKNRNYINNIIDNVNNNINNGGDINIDPNDLDYSVIEDGLKEMNDLRS